MVGTMRQLRPMDAPRKWGRRLHTLFVLLSGASFWSACTESGQILRALDDTQEAPAVGGAPQTGSGGEMQSMGGMPEGDFVEGPTGTQVSVAAGDGHSCAVFDGALYCFGDNQNGALGLGDFASQATPTRVGSASDWSLIGSGDGFSCGVRSGGVWCWGRGSSGQLGTGQFASSTVPLAVNFDAFAGSLEVEALDVGHQHACAISVDGALFCWGQNSEGQLAQADPWPDPGVNSSVPVRVGAGETWSKVACGQGHTCAIRADSSLWCWGRNSGGELGLGSEAEGQLREPARVGAEVDWEDVSAGQNHTCGVRAGVLYCWGNNESGQLGLDVDSFTPVPTLVPGLSAVRSVSVDTFHSCVIGVEGDLFCVGRNIEGQLGDGTIDAKSVPTAALPADDWDQVSVGRFHTCGVRGGAVRCTGENAQGRLGVGDNERRREFTPTLYFTEGP